MLVGCLAERRLFPSLWRVQVLHRGKRQELDPRTLNLREREKKLIEKEKSDIKEYVQGK
jgi:hypothetical protein